VADVLAILATALIVDGGSTERANAVALVWLGGEVVPPPPPPPLLLLPTYCAIDSGLLAW
jgi:hypothetical protein